MATQSLAVKYRPKTFDDVTEQGAIKIILTEQIRTGTIKNVYLFCGGAGTGKTTCARIFANEINKGIGVPIEMDAASNNSVDDVREIITQSKTKPIDGAEYKVFIIDECVTGETEILTDSGFKRFDALDGTEKVAQYSDDGRITFVTPSEFIKLPYKGNLKVWNPRKWCSVRMTPNHVQPLHYVKSDTIKECYAKDLHFTQNKELIVSGVGCGNNDDLTIYDRLAIICQADGTLQYTTDTHTRWLVSFKKKRKIERFLSLCKTNNFAISEVHSTRDGVRRFTFDMPLNTSKSLSTYFDANMGYDRARQFIDEVRHWDGHTNENYLYYSSTVKENVDFVSIVATLGGYSSRVRVEHDNRSGNYSDVYRLYMYDTCYSSCQHIQKTYHDEYFDGFVYCVKVPTHKIVVRADGFTFVTGNCHALSNSAWQSMLKLIEEPPSKAVFIFCTTDPQKIPKTILSRVQRYDFQRISRDGIVNRLHHILGEEYTEKEYDGADIKDNNISWKDGALEYIAKLADGGMRDAITLLDKCLAYSTEVTLDNVVSALGVADYSTMFDLTDRIFNKDMKGVIDVVESVHMSGKDLKQFVKTYMLFLLDIAKYDVTQSFKYLEMPQIYEEKLFAYGDYEFEECRRLLSKVIELNADIKWETSPKAMIESVLMLECVKDV